MRGYENAKGHVLLKPERPKQIKAKKEKGLNTRGHMIKMKWPWFDLIKQLRAPTWAFRLRSNGQDCMPMVRLPVHGRPKAKIQWLRLSHEAIRSESKWDHNRWDQRLMFNMEISSPSSHIQTRAMKLEQKSNAKYKNNHEIKLEMRLTWTKQSNTHESTNKQQKSSTIFAELEDFKQDTNDFDLVLF